MSAKGLLSNCCPITLTPPPRDGLIQHIFLLKINLHSSKDAQGKDSQNKLGEFWVLRA